MNRYEALKHAVKAHAGAVDKCGKPYILHPIAVADACERAGMGETTIVVALLHDVLEDTNYAFGPNAFGTAPEQWHTLIALTRRDGEPYVDYIERICMSRVFANQVKLADLWHNLQPERQDCLPSKEQASLEKRYLKARDRIWEALGYEWWPSESREG